MYSSGSIAFVLLLCSQSCRSLTSGRWCSTTLGGGTGIQALAPDILSVLFRRCRTSPFLHEGPAEEGDEDHGQPRGHLGEGPGDVSVRNGEAVLLHDAVEGVEGTLVRGNLVNLVLKNKLLEGLGGGRGAVQGLVAVLGDGRGLISQRLGDVELDQRRRANAPRVAQDLLLLAVEVTKLGRRGPGGKDSCRGLVSLEHSSMGLVANTYVPCLLSRPAETIACAVTAGDEDKPLRCRGRADGGVNSQDFLPVLECERVLDRSGGLGCCGLDRRRRGDHRGHGRGRLVEEALHLVQERNLLLSERERRQGEDSCC
jgi:hypothetical protein